MPSENPALPDATRLAVDRTRMAADRTLLAWVRTSTSLISFGFTIYKFFQYLRESQKVEPVGLLGPRGFALLMIGIGVVVLVVATIQHRQDMKELRTEYGRVRYSLATMLAALIGTLGVLGLLAVVFRQ
jgi:putative membrane protein